MNRAGLFAPALKGSSEELFLGILFIIPVVQAGVIGENDIYVRGISGVFVLPRVVLFKRMRYASDGADSVPGLVETCEQQREKCRVIAQSQPSRLSVVFLKIHAHSAVIGAVKIKFPDLEILFIDNYITKHDLVLLVQGPQSGLLP